MDIYHEDLSDVDRYIERNASLKLEEKEEVFNSLFASVKKYKDINPSTKILEIGTGTGWLPIMCKMKGLDCKGIEVSPSLIQFAKQLGQKYGVVPDITLGNVEDARIGSSDYDVIIATSCFEHVEHWKKGLERVFEALKPGGLFYFCSTNKFAFKSGEYDFPLYGWLPNRLRYRVRKHYQGEDIMKLGIDFNQFNYFQLRRFFKSLGFSIVMDMLDILDPEDLANPKHSKIILLKSCKRIKLLKALTLLFVPATKFICIK